MPYKVVTNVSNEGSVFSTLDEALASWQSAVAVKETETGEPIKTKIDPAVTSIHRTLELLEDGTGFTVTDVYDSVDVYNERMRRVMPGWEAAGITINDPLNGWIRTVISSGNVE